MACDRDSLAWQSGASRLWETKKSRDEPHTWQARKPTSSCLRFGEEKSATTRRHAAQFDARASRLTASMSSAKPSILATVAVVAAVSSAVAGSKRKRSEDAPAGAAAGAAADAAAATGAGAALAAAAGAAGAAIATEVARGLPASGRFWKPLQRERFTAANRPNAVPAAGKGMRSGAFTAQQAERAARRAAAAHGARLLAERTAERKARGMAMAAKRARKAE